MVDDFNTSNHEIKKYNNLKNEKSPYLLEHASNPVDWFPWSSKAFEKARNEDKPIFLSIGYSSCHWCHVMARESFEDQEVASLLNEAFINIKVDREERPDIDKIYMDICQMLTGSGGWPLSIIMTPDKKPFFAATYIPKESKYGHTGMMDLVRRISDIWQNQRDKATRSAEDIADALNRLSKKTATDKLDISILDSTYNNLSNFFDDENGGFGQSPKFPSPHNLIFLLRYWKRTKEDRALFMVEKTLQAMNMGGIWDHVGFGFHRYSTDPQWLLPHFEKMLYDQAMLSMAYTEAFLVTKKPEYKKTAEQIFTYILRDMTSRDGGFADAYPPAAAARAPATCPPPRPPRKPSAVAAAASPGLRESASRAPPAHRPTRPCQCASGIRRWAWPARGRAGPARRARRGWDGSAARSSSAVIVSALRVPRRRWASAAAAAARASGGGCPGAAIRS